MPLCPSAPSSAAPCGRARRRAPLPARQRPARQRPAAAAQPRVEQVAQRVAVYDELERCTGFQWDLGNSGKNGDKHRVADGEAEEIFFNGPLVAAVDL